MDVPLQSSYTSSAGTIGKISSFDDALMKNKLTDVVKLIVSPLGSQDLFDDSYTDVPTETNNASIIEDEQDDEISDEKSHIDDNEDHDIVPIDNTSRDEDFMDVSHAQSQNTPGDDFYQKRMNFDTPNVESTQTFFNMMNNKISPPKRRSRTDIDFEEPLNNTQAYFNMARHYENISRDRKKDFQIIDDSEKYRIDTGKKPLRRKLFDGVDDFSITNNTNCPETLGNADDLLLSIILPEKKKSKFVIKSNLKTSSIKTHKTETKLKTATKSLKIINSEYVCPEINTNVDPYRTPLNRVTKIPDIHTVSTLDATHEVPMAVTRLDSGVSLITLTSTKEVSPPKNHHKSEPLQNTGEQEKLSDENERCKKSMKGGEDKIPIIDDVQHPEICGKEIIKICQKHDILTTHSAISKKANSDVSQKAGLSKSSSNSNKRKMVAQPEFRTENRVYKVRRVEEPQEELAQEEELINCPEIVSRMFTLTKHPARGVPSYPPEINKVVPIPVQETAHRRKTGLSRRRSLRTSLHPYLINPGVLRNEE